MLETIRLIFQINRFSFERPGIKRLAVFFLVFCIIIAALPISTTYVFSLILNQLIKCAETKNIGPVGYLAFMYAVLQILPFFLRNVSSRINSRLQMYLRTHTQIALERKMANLDYEYFDDPLFHDLIKSVKEKGVATTFGIFLLQFDVVDIIVQITLATAAISLIGFKYAVVLAIAIVPIIIVETWKRKNRKRIYEENRTDSRHAGVYLNEIGTRESRIFNLNDAFLGKYAQMTEDVIHRMVKFEDRRMIIDIGAFVIFGIGLVYVLKQAFFQIAMGVLEAGDAVLIIGAVWTFSATLRSLIATLAELYENQLYAKEFFEFLELPHSIEVSDSGKKPSFEHGVGITIQRLSFSYPGKSTQALSEINLDIRPGEKVAFVGENGGGKSTIIKMLLRFYDPQFGVILVNGVPSKEVNLRYYRNQIGYVAQNPSIPNLIIKEVISPLDEITDDDLSQVLERSKADEFVKKYQFGTEQQLGKMFKNGVSPSDGQRQRLAIARAYAKKPKLIIFDEPTSDLDPETQAHIFQDFYNNNPGVTGILVAHSLQGVMHADQIFVFENGTITQIGTHAQLLVQDGWYRRSFLKQFKDVSQTISI